MRQHQEYPLGAARWRGAPGWASQVPLVPRPQGPFVHIGACIASILAQGGSKRFHLQWCVSLAAPAFSLLARSATRPASSQDPSRKLPPQACIPPPAERPRPAGAGDLRRLCWRCCRLPRTGALPKAAALCGWSRSQPAQEARLSCGSLNPGGGFAVRPRRALYPLAPTGAAGPQICAALVCVKRACVLFASAAAPGLARISSWAPRAVRR